jgi:pimeloyl-ACP methyl ester carboxylesterase
LLAIVAALLVATIGALYINGRVYAARVEKRWPPMGRFVTVDGVRLHLIERGSPAAPPVLFLHGATANAREFLSLAPLIERDHRLMLLDRPGYGYSERPPHAARIGVQARLIARLLDQERADPVLIVCHSLGCGVALRIAIERPDLVRGLVMAAPASHPYPGRNDWWAHVADAPIVGPIFSSTLVPLAGPFVAKSAVARIFAPAEPTERYEEMAGVPLAFRARAFRASARDTVATKREYPLQARRYEEIEAPAVILISDRDPVVNADIHGRSLVRDLPSAELVTLPGTGHVPHQLRPDAMVSAIRRIEHIQTKVAAAPG